MDFTEFEARAHEAFAAIPPQYREGVDGLEVERATVPHPSLPEVYTLGECKSEFYPSEFGGPGEVRSLVVLYYGSFLALSRLRAEDWDWDEEIWETVTHEVRHHLESLAAEDALEEMDYAEDQNFARREGETFDPFFFRSGARVGPGTYEVDGDVFVELEVDGARVAREGVVTVPWAGRRLTVRAPERLGDVHFLRVPDAVPEPGELHLVLVRRRGAWDLVRGFVSRARLEVLESEAEAEGEGSG